MKTIFYIFTFLLLTLPMSNVFACGKTSKKATIEQSVCEPTNSNQATKNKSCCDSDGNDDNGCNGGCKNPNCHCPVTVNFAIPSNNLVVNLTSNLRLFRINWTYVQNALKPIYLSIWQPPKIS